MGKRKLLIVQCAALGKDLLAAHGMTTLAGMEVRTCAPVFPGLTCTAQASFRTALPPSGHGIVANGFFDRTLMKSMFWEQSANLVTGKRIWQDFRKNGGKVGIFFWQQSLGEECDWILSPAPIHKHHGGMIQNLYSKPAGLAGTISSRTGDFDLMHYWGPMASVKSSDWIAAATAEAIAMENAPELCLTYLPALDYDLQRFGPDSKQAAKALESLRAGIEMLKTAAEKNGYELIVFGDYAITKITGTAIMPNLHLRKAGLFATRKIKAMEYPDFYQSKAFALADHQIAHVYCLDAGAKDKTIACLKEISGIDRIMDVAEQAAEGIRHERSGDLVITAKQGSWFAYPWWEDESEAPEYARHVDIHSKPGYDPCELYFGWPPFTVSRNTVKIRGSHGIVASGGPAAWLTTIKDEFRAADICDLANQSIEWISR